MENKNYITELINEIRKELSEYGETDCRYLTITVKENEDGTFTSKRREVINGDTVNERECVYNEEGKIIGASNRYEKEKDCCERKKDRCGCKGECKESASSDELIKLRKENDELRSRNDDLTRMLEQEITKNVELSNKIRKIKEMF